MQMKNSVGPDLGSTLVSRNGIKNEKVEGSALIRVKLV